MENKNGQVWGFDLMIGITIFMLGILIFFLYTLNTSPESEDKINSLTYDGNFIADSLLSDGYPANWDSSNVIRIGLTTDNRINQTKLDEFYSFTTINYEKTKNILNTRYDYYITFSDDIKVYEGTPSEQTIPYIGKISPNPSDLVKVSRVTIYKNKPITLYIYLWQ